MAGIAFPDFLKHNNSVDYLVDSYSVKGGGIVVADTTALYALSAAPNKLKEKITIAYVTALSQYYILTDITNIGNSAGWTLDPGSLARSYVHTQGITSATWTINHNLGFYPNIRVQTSAGVDVIGDVTYTNINTITVTFSAGFQGTAYLS